MKTNLRRVAVPATAAATTLASAIAEGTSPPLDTVRRASVGLSITGNSVSAAAPVAAMTSAGLAALLAALGLLPRSRCAAGAERPR